MCTASIIVPIINHNIEVTRKKSYSDRKLIGKFKKKLVNIKIQKNELIVVVVIKVQH